MPVMSAIRAPDEDGVLGVAMVEPSLEAPPPPHFAHRHVWRDR
jgi:hypothetical protein